MNKSGYKSFQDLNPVVLINNQNKKNKFGSELEQVEKELSAH
jgi:hypothetical protein